MCARRLFALRLLAQNRGVFPRPAPRCPPRWAGSTIKTQPKIRQAGAVVELTALLILFTVPTWAHHSFSAEFDGSKRIELTGIVARLEWTNPHVWLYIDVKGPDGKIVNWALEGHAPNRLYRSGWHKVSVKFGDTVTVDGYLAKDRTNTAQIFSIILPDGRKVLGDAVSTGAPESKYERAPKH